jgi:hypothetical protein
MDEVNGEMMMAQRADLVVYDADGQISLIVEARSKTDTSRSWATEMRRNMLAHGLMPKSRFFLLALPDRLYLWKDVENLPELIEPTYEIDATPFFQPYFEKSKLTPNSIIGQSFELIVTSWLNELIRSGISSNVPTLQRAALEESGLLEALQGGRVSIELSV